MLRLINIVFFSFIGIGVLAQPYSNQRLKKIIELSDTIKLDTMSIIPNSVFIIDVKGNVIDSSNYFINYSRALFLPNQKFQGAGIKEITIIYRVFPIFFSKEYFNKDKKKLISSDSLLGILPSRYALNPTTAKPFGDNIEASGSISRGITFGSNQDAVVNSGLNLQISGMIDNHINIEGAISDKTVPFQSQGNTQRLEEFDRIYLRAYTSNFEIQAGDVELRSRSNSFLRFNRNVQGLDVAIQNDFISKDDSTRIQASASVAKGKFSRNTFNGIEGNQGPYKLTGAEGETYLIIIAGSERVYIDGTLLTRGESNHYTIDYNSAELNFTPLMRITGNSRINIEFEYTERSYARFLVTSTVEHKIRNTTVRVNAFSEQDGKNQPVDQELGSDQVEMLRGIGDRIDQAIIPQVDSVGFSPNKIMYEKRDTSIGLNNYRIYKYSTNSAAAHFTVNFSYLGEGKGNYVPRYSSANGRVYDWIAPLNGKPSGSFEPIRILVTPKRKQMATIAIDTKFSNSDYISSEVAFSRNDINTFSSIDKSNDIGEAARVRFRRSIKSDSIRSIWVFGEGVITSSNFTFVDRFRPVEFERDWNIGYPLAGGSEKEINGGVGFKTSKWLITGTSQGLLIDKDYKGFRNGIGLIYKSSKMSNEVALSNVRSSDSLKTSSFNRMRVKSNITFNKIDAGVTFEGEDNSQQMVKSKSLMPGTFRWIQSEFNIGLSDSLPRMVAITYKYRKDWKATDSLLRLYSYAQDIGVKARLAKNQNSRLNIYIGYRLLNPIDSSLSKTIRKENTLLGRLDYYFVIAKGFVSSNLGYEIGNGLEPKYQFYYIEVPAGQGIYTWKDYNTNGIKELNEFEIAAFKDEAKYIRINLASNQYLSVSNNALNVQLDIQPENVIKDTSSISIFIKKLSNQFSYNTRQKNRFLSFSKSMNPLLQGVYDTNLVSITSNFRNSIAFNRFSRTFGVEWINGGSISKGIQANGYEMIRVMSNQIVAWIGISTVLSARINFFTENKIHESEFFQQRNFSIKRNIPNLKLRYIGMLGFSSEIGYEYEYAKNRLGSEVNKMQTLSAELSYSIRSKSWINIKSNLSKIDFNGGLETPIEYEFLRGFKPGTNATWELNYRRKISTYFEMNIGYNGRYISTGNVVHTGSMEVRALF